MSLVSLFTRGYSSQQALVAGMTKAGNGLSSGIELGVVAQSTERGFMAGLERGILSGDVNAGVRALRRIAATSDDVATPQIRQAAVRGHELLVATRRDPSSMTDQRAFDMGEIVGNFFREITERS